jgi:RimJ/RimL family protein N-acetyltransferase
MKALKFEPLSETHIDAVDDLFQDPTVLRFTRIPDPPPARYARTWLDRYQEGRADATREGFDVFDGAGAFVGLALAPQINPEGNELELGYLVAPDARGRGVASEMLRWLTRWAFDELGAERAYLIIDVENAASQSVATRCGYQREGVMRSMHLKQGRRIDAQLWSRLPSDPS